MAEIRGWHKRGFTQAAATVEPNCFQPYIVMTDGRKLASWKPCMPFAPNVPHTPTMFGGSFARLSAAFRPSEEQSLMGQP